MGYQNVTYQDMKSQACKISVLMPVYNSQRFLRESVDSISNQNYSDFEFIIVNDGSTDDTRQLVEELARSDHRIVLINTKNFGIANALNVGLERCTGEFIARMDGDDIAHPNRLAIQLEHLRSRESLVALGCQVRIIDSAGNELRTTTLPSSTTAIDAYGLQFGGGAIIHPAMMLRTAVLRSVGGYRSPRRYAQDFDLLLRLAEVGELTNLPDVLMSYRIHSDQASRPYNIDQVLSGIWALEQAGLRRGIDVRPYLAKHYVRAAWQATDLGRKREGLRYAWAAWCCKPGGAQGAKALARCFAKSLLPSRSVGRATA